MTNNITAEDMKFHQWDIIDITTRMTTDIPLSTFTGVKGTITLLIELDK